MSELTFFVGKGGVGKTTISSAYALQLAASAARNVLLVSTDPAHSLSDVLGQRLGGTPRKIGARLLAWEIDAAARFRNFLAREKDELVDAVERGSLFTREEISSLLNSALPGMSEMAALLAIQDALDSGKYSDVVVDTAPFGHALRLFTLPQQFVKLLNVIELAAERDRVLAAHFASAATIPGTAAVTRWRNSLSRLQESFANAKLFLVTTAEKFALNESVRCLEELNKADLRLSSIVLNRIIASAGRCARCKQRARAGREARGFLESTYANIPIHTALDPGFPIQGAVDLKRFAKSLFGRKPLALASRKLRPQSAPKLKKSDWPAAAKPLTFILGKGGVGKTTVSAGLGYYTRQSSGIGVEVCSVDPAPSLDDVFGASITDRPKPVLGDRKFRACELDSVALFKSWIADIRAAVEDSTSAQQHGIHVDLSYERRLFSELLEIVPPGLDEVLAVFRIVEMLARDRRVIIDMAPTGHALELLRMPEKVLTWSRLLLKSLSGHRKLALAREAAVKIAELEVRARELVTVLQSGQAAVFAVMLPEPLPDRETERLLGDLRELHLTPEAVFVNRVVASSSTPACARCASAAGWQAKVLRGLKQRLPEVSFYVLPDFGAEISGKSGLQKLTRVLWQLA